MEKKGSSQSKPKLALASLRISKDMYSQDLMQLLTDAIQWIECVLKITLY